MNIPMQFSRKVQPAPAAPPVKELPSATTIGALVVMLTRSHTSYQSRKDTLEAEIAARTEELRQVNAALSSLGAALMAAADDPMLTDVERMAAEQAGQVQMDEALSGLDLNDPHQFERYPPHSPERWMAGLSGMVPPRNEVTDAV